jgi:hypothetical protein
VRRSDAVCRDKRRRRRRRGSASWQQACTTLQRRAWWFDAHSPSTGLGSTTRSFPIPKTHLFLSFLRTRAPSVQKVSLGRHLRAVFVRDVSFYLGKPLGNDRLDLFLCRVGFHVFRFDDPHIFPGRRLSSQPEQQSAIRSGHFFNRSSSETHHFGPRMKTALILPLFH